MGYSIIKEFPSRFLRGEEIGDKAVKLTIKAVKKEKGRNPDTKKDEDILVVYFDGKDRGVRLSKSRARDIAAIYGDNTDGWVGGIVEMYTEKMSAFGKQIIVIRFTSPKSLL